MPIIRPFTSRESDPLTRRLYGPRYSLHPRRRKIQRARMGVVVQIERPALAPVDQHRHQQNIAIHALRRNLVALDDAVFVVPAGGAPILLETRKRIRAPLRRMLLPVGIVHPDAVGLGQIVLFHRRQEPVHSRSAKEMVVPVPGPVRGHAGHQPPAHKQRQQQPPGAIQHHAPAPVASLIKHRSVEQSHRKVSSNLE